MYHSKKFENVSTVSQSGGNIRLHGVVYSKCLCPGVTKVILNQDLELGVRFGQGDPMKIGKHSAHGQIWVQKGYSKSSLN